MRGLTLLALLGCGPRPLVVVPGARRLAELANGELLIGTAAGDLVLVSSFGDQRALTRLASEPVELVTDPLGVWHARLADGRVFAGGLWGAPEQVGEGARLLLRDCEQTRIFIRSDLGAPGAEPAGAEPGDDVVALGLATCEQILTGTASGLVEGQAVSSAPIRHVQRAGDGALWVDAEGHAGCLGCASPVPREGVVDAAPLHVVPFLPGEFAWIDEGGAVWIDAD